MKTGIMLRLVLIFVTHCLLTNGQGPGPGRPNFLFGIGSTDSINIKSRAVDTRVKFTIFEGQPPNSYVGVIPIKPGYTYRFNEPPHEFILNSTTGIIRTATNIDREQLVSDSFDLVVLSSQPTYPIEVRIEVIDINDNSPKFPEPSIHVSFSENANSGTRVILDTATDGDVGENDITINYKIVNGNQDDKFRLVVTTNPSGETPYLHLETTERLDREAIDSYQLNISAQDGGDPSHFGFLLVNVSILDVNDNSPTFDHSDYNVSLSESVEPGTSLLNVKATDIDVGDNAKIVYYLSDSETQFSVDSKTGIITTVEPLVCFKNCPIEIRCQKRCVFTVFARDHGSPRQDGRTYVTVNLQDANDHDPIVNFRYFNDNIHFGSVDENAENGSVVAVVSITDNDEDLNGETTVEIRGGNELNHFLLNFENNFDIVRVNGILDREKISKYNVTVVATDKGTPVRSSTAFMILLVNDINDHEPVFEKSEYSAVLSELVPIGTYVAGITANDEDTGVNSNIYYDITDGNDNQWFHVDRKSGLITTKAKLDREIEDSVVLQISAKDGGPNPKRAFTHLKITILDENDEVPTFNLPSINVTLLENSTSNTLVAVVFAIDRDRGTNGSIIYSFDEEVEHKYPGIFHIDSSSGHVTTNRALDREICERYEIKVVASDQGIPPLSSTTTIYLKVEDINDNSPAFYPHQYFVVVREDLPIGSSVLQVSAIDRDEGQNAVVIYELNGEGNNDNTFEIDSNSGIISLSGRLSRVKKPQHKLSVTARDGMGRKTSKNAIVDVIIGKHDIDALQFMQNKGYKFSTVEDIGTNKLPRIKQIGTIATKPDSTFGKVIYSIISGDPNQTFSIEPNSGILKAVKSINREEMNFYSLQIVAKNSKNFGVITANISIKDVNDNPPAFPVTKGYTVVQENWPVGFQVYLAQAFDPDEGLNQRLTYRLTKNPDNYFYISHKTGMIYLNKPIKFEHVKNILLEVTATDSGIPVLSSKQEIIVDVIDVNDHTPIFEHESYETSLLESTPVNDRFFALTASDKDDGDNGFISYEITEGNKNNKFGIFPDGYLFVRSSLDREQRDYFALTIVAKDHGTPPRSSTVSVVIHILDENDNRPFFTNRTFIFHLDENEPPDTYVGRLTALDRDKGRNAELTYSISSSQKQFMIDPKSGFIKTLQYFDREKLLKNTGLDYIAMEGIVLDNGIKRLEDKSKIIIYISDINDNPPKFDRKSYKAEVSENSPILANIIRVTASDEDDEANSKITYAILSGNNKGCFSLNQQTGQLTLIKSLDRERVDFYRLKISASDNGHPTPLSAGTTIIINVLDENDNAPEFTIDKYEISVFENTPVNTKLFQFSATDRDLRMNKEISFVITAGNIAETFRIDIKSGTLSLDRLLDYEQRKYYKLNITAFDNGSPRHSSSVPFIVHLLDFNDNAPIFPKTAIVRQIKEGIFSGTAIVTVMAEDPDSGVNGQIKYSIKKQDPKGKHFTIDENTGVIYTSNDIDREFSDIFRISVLATDQATNPMNRLSADKLITVIVEDINDNAPLFVSMNAGIIPANAAIGYEIMVINATDKDANSNGQVSYDLSGRDMEYFNLERNGSLRLKRELSPEMHVCQANVRASDEAVKSHIQFIDTAIHILVENRNQDGLQFSQTSYSGSIPEGAGIGSSVASVEASYPGISPMAITYYVVNTTNRQGQIVDKAFDFKKHTILSTTVVLDREVEPDEYIVTIAAIVSEGLSSHLSTAEVRITVEDKNDSPPSLDNFPLHYTVSEDLLPGRTITTVVATDPDTVGNITYSVVTGDGSKFNLDPSSGVLSIRNTLDRETKDRYELTVRADDGKHYTDAVFIIEVTDTNDNSPVFNEYAYSFDIPEDFERGSKVGTVSADDIDMGINGHVSYTVISDWGNDIFSLNPQSGVFTLTSRLDYEQIQHYIFVVQAQDTGKPALSSTATVYFNVQDSNDNSPLFDPMSYSDEILENITVGSSVLTISATDQDSGQNGLISYNISGGDDKDQFSINENGIVLTRAPLDREDQSFYNLIVTATDQAVPDHTRLTSTVQVTIILKDVNDMAPEFVTPNKTTVVENTPINTVVMAIKAIDRDEGRNSYIEYSLEQVPKNTFMLGSADGLLRVTELIDREDTANYTLMVTAKDRGVPSNARTLTISLKVEDENDNSPIFDPKQYSASVPENASIGLSILQVSATDADEALNSKVRYTIVAGDNNRDFTISEGTGVIRVAKNLNYERRNHYLITVQAEDSGIDVRYDSATVTISIMDINDNAPVFLDSPYLIYVMENTRGLPSPIGTVTAFDADNSPYNKVNYLVKEGDKTLFAVNSTNGEISLMRSMDREIQDEYTLTIVAMDTGTPRLTGTGTISILVEDENDHDPQFPKSDYTVSVSEGVSIGTPVLTVSATDKDSGINAKIRYSLVGENNIFSVDQETGILKTKSILDREQTPIYSLLVEARDSSLTEPRSSTTKVIVKVTDENDNAPTFPQKEYHVYIPNPTITGNFVFGDSAIDPDEGDNGKIIYHLSGRDAANFDLDQWKGIIKASTELSSERMYEVIIGAQDFGTLPLSSSMRLKIRLRPKSQFPSFEPIKRSLIFSEAAKGELVTTVKANSPKVGHASVIRYRIAGGNIGNAFEIDKKSGNLYISQNGLDYEKFKQYEIYLSAEDSDSPPLGLITSITVNVTDYNDNEPKFSQEVYNTSLMEDLYPPELIATVSATDEDVGVNGKFSYRFKPGTDAQDAFTLDGETGKIFTKIKLRREEVDHYNLIVEAIDQGSPPQTGSAMILVNVQDKNNNPPRFTRLFSVNVTENAEVGTFVIQVTSSDKDIGENANVTYSFTKNPYDKFKIDPVSGNVTVAKAIDREVRDEYSLKVSASDGSWKAETPLTITVQDENDNPPTFESRFYELNFPELRRNVAFVGQVRATDRDKHGPNSAISFSLKFPSDFFSINSVSGEILSKQALKYKHTNMKGSSPENQYYLTIIATDAGKPPLSSEASILINVVDANNNRPRFEKDTYMSPVPYNTKIGDKIIQVKASDNLDYGINAQIIYSEIGGNGTDYFTLESSTGHIRLSKDINDKIGTQYVLFIRAKDNGVPPLHDEVFVTLVVTGENLHKPKFTASSYQVIIAENEKVGSIMGTVTATDDDIGPNGIMRYSITSGNEDNKFSINEETGAMKILSELDYDTVPLYQLNITTHDLAFNAQYATAVFTVLLTDVNDNPPIFSKNEYLAYIPENSDIGTSIFKVEAIDIDSALNAVISYNIVNSEEKNNFHINTETGVIMSKKVFNFEERTKYILNIRASNPDSFQKNNTARVIVHVTGTNEFFPKFSKPVFKFFVSESAPIGTSVGTIEATDEDRGEDGIVYYLLVGSSNDRGFLIESSTGILSVARYLDRETQNRVVLTVMAKNRGSIRGNDTDLAQIIISIQDGNDPPVFEKMLYKTHLSEGVAIGTKVHTVKATDADVKPENNQFTYTIIGGNKDQAFKVDPQTGVIETSALLDRETVRVYNLTLGAIDNGKPSQTGTTLVQVILEDVNDNGPQFDLPEIIGYVQENEPSMTSVMTLSAKDPDLPPNTQPFSYFLIGGDHKDFFLVDKSTGEVKTRRALDRESTSELNIKIEVEDNGIPRMKSEFPVKIIVLDKNDSPSTPRKVLVKVRSYMNYFAGGKIADIRPNDADTSGQYSCQILRKDSTIFSIPNACNLHVTMGSHYGSYALSVFGNDGLHDNVISKVIIEFDSFDNESLDNSIVARFLNISADQFLRSYYNTYEEFINQYIDGKLEIYSVSNTDSHTDLIFSIRRNSQEYITPLQITTELRLKQNVLRQKLQGVQIKMGYNPCEENPCENNGKCSSTIYISKSTEIADSPSLILASPSISNNVMCQCREGFTGKRCQLRQDPCSPNPCNFGGTCTRKGFSFICACPPSRQGTQCEVDKTNACDNNPCRNGGSCQMTLEGGFFCLCRPGYRGNQCELESESCRPNPCQNGGSCIPLRPGYKCSCNMNFYGSHCEKSTYSFDKLSFMTFPTLDSTTNDISVVFSTNKPDSLLIYNYGMQTGGRSDFVAIEITSGQPRFSYGGARTEITSVALQKNVTDGKWYKITATRNGRVISISVSECSRSGDICKECQPADPTCYADTLGPTGTLNFNNEPMYFGGVMTVDPIQERPNQVHADDFVGCVQRVSINGRPLNLSGPIKQRGISNTCKRSANVCLGEPCENSGICLDRWSTYKCLCSNGLRAPDCRLSMKPVTFTGKSYVEFMITEQHRRKQLLPRFYHKHSRWVRNVPRTSYSRQLSLLPSKHLSFRFRTKKTEGVLLYAATNNDYTLIEIRSGRIQYTSKLGANRPMNMTVMEPRVDSGRWHNLTLLLDDRSFTLLLDGNFVSEQLEMAAIHDFLDAYLTSFSLGGAPQFTGSLPYKLKRFIGCMAMLSIDGEVQPFNSSEGSLLMAAPHGVVFQPDCATLIGPISSTDPLSVGITLVIAFFILLLLALSVSFLVYKLRMRRKEKDGGHVFQNGSALLANTSSESGRTPQDSGFVESAEMTEEVLRSHLTHELSAKKYKEREHERPQRPDIIEREVLNKSPGMPLRVDDPHGADSMGLVHIPDPEQPEHYDLENASSIAPSDIDIVYHYKGYRDGNIRKYKTNPHVPGYHKHNHRHSPHNFPTTTPHRESPRNILRQSPNPVVSRDSPGLKMQSTPLARLSPSSELSQQTPRILTLQDLSGKPLQTALLATSQGQGVKDVMSNSERSLNSPVSHLSQSSGSIRTSSQSAKKKKHDPNVGLGLTVDDIDRLNGRPRNSSLLSTLDAVSSSSEGQQRKEKLAELIETNTELLEAADSSTDESGNDSFTCSEFEYDNTYEKVTRDFGPGTMIFSKLAEVDNENDHDNESAKNFEVFDSFRGSLSTLVASDDDLSNMSSYKPPNGSKFGWDYLLNWGPNYETLVGVFKDIAELPDANLNNINGRISNRETPRPSEEYV